MNDAVTEYSMTRILGWNDGYEWRRTLAGSLHPAFCYPVMPRLAQLLFGLHSAASALSYSQGYAALC